MWVLLIGLWIGAVYFMWDAMTTVPSADRLEETRLAAIPTPRTFFAAVAFSAMELALVLAAAWPWRPELYASRLALGALIMVTWFVSTVPMELSGMDRVHRQWLALTILTLVAAVVVVLSYRLARRIVVRPRGAGGARPIE